MGKIELDHTGSGGGVTLSSDGTDLLLDGTAVGGGADLYAANESSPTAQPSATGANAIAIGDGATASGADAFAIGDRPVASGIDAVALGNLAYASGNNSFAFDTGSNSGIWGSKATGGIALGRLTTVEASYGVAIGADVNGNGGKVGSSGDGAVALGCSFANGAGAFAAAIGTNSSSYGATGNKSIAMGDSSKATGSYALAIGGPYATATGISAIAIGRGAATANGAISIGPYASYGQPSASAATSISIGDGSSSAAADGVALGSRATVASGGDRAVALGYSRASGAGSFAAGIDNNSSTYGATGSSSVALGYRAKASGSFSSIAVGLDAVSSGRASIAMGEGAAASADSAVCLGEDSTTSGANGSIIGGYLNTASGLRSAILGGYSNSATYDYSIAMGSQAKSDKYGKIAHATGAFANAGDAQGAIYVLRASTTDATPKVLATIDGQADANTQIVAASDTCITFDGTITAMQNGAQAYASWKIEGLLVNDGGTTTLANSATTVIQNLSSWGMALSADNTNNALAITCTGEAAHNIRWVANIRTTEVTYA